MATIKSDWINGTKPMPQPNGAEVVNVTLTLAVLAAETAADDIYEMGELPEDCALVDAIYASTDIDTNGTPTVVLDFGVVNAGGTDLDTTLEAGLTIGQAGGAARLTPTATTLTTVTGGAARSKLGYKVATVSATGADGTVTLNLSYRATTYGA